MICPHCGANIPQDCAICPWCGAAVIYAPVQPKRAAPVPDYFPAPSSTTAPPKKKNTVVVILILAALLIVGTAITVICILRQDSADPEIGWQDHYDLGSRFLSEGNYEAAALAFCTAIDIDPKRSEAYMGAAEAYVALGNLEAAEDILEECEENTGENLWDQLEILIEKWFPKQEPESEPETEPETEPIPTPGRKLSSILESDSDGHHVEYVFSYNEKGQLASIQCYWYGEPSTTEQYFYDEQGRFVRKAVDGVSYDMFIYDDAGKLIQSSEIFGDFHFDHFYHYNDNGILTSETYHDHFMGPETEEITYLCDAQNRILEKHYEDGPSLYFTYDDQGRVRSQVRSSDDTVFLTYNYDDYKPFVTASYGDDSHTLLLQDSFGHEIWELVPSLGLTSVQSDEEGYILSAQNSQFKYTFFYEESTQADPQDS